MEKIKKILKELGFTIRIGEDGKKIEQYVMFPANMEGSRLAAEHAERYKNSKEVIYLPMVSTFNIKHDEEIADFCRLGHDSLMYSAFISQLFKKGQFIACDKEGNVLEALPEPTGDFITEVSKGFTEEMKAHLERYQQAKELVIFDSVLQYDDETDGCQPYLEIDGWEININESPIEYVNLENGESFYFETIEQATNNGLKLILKD